MGPQGELKLANFRSFRGEQTFDLIASKRLGEAAPPYGVILPGTQESVLRLAALYGANGAGKSNLVKALGWAQHLVLRGTELDKPIARVPFRLDEESRTQPTLFEVRFLAGERVFQYGFSVDSQRVHEEWLDVFSGSRDATERRSDDPETARLVELAALLETLPPKVQRAMLSGPDGEELLFTSKAGVKVMMSRIMAQHRLPGDAVVSFPLAEESDGTRRLLHLLPALHKGRNEPSVFVIDAGMEPIETLASSCWRRKTRLPRRRTSELIEARERRCISCPPPIADQIHWPCSRA